MEHPLKEKIKKKGIKIVWIAEQIGMKQSMLTRCLKGDRILKPEKEEAIKQLIHK